MSQTLLTKSGRKGVDLEPIALIGHDEVLTRGRRSTKEGGALLTIVLLAIAFCWAHKTGEWRCTHEQKIKLKKHGRRAQNIFRYGLDLLQDTVSAINKMACKMTKLISILVQPFDSNKQLGNFVKVA